VFQKIKFKKGEKKKMTALPQPVSSEGFDFTSDLLLESDSKKYYKISKSAFKLCENFYQSVADSLDGNEELILPSECPDEYLPLIILYCEYHKDSKPAALPQPLRKPLDEYLDQWDKQYLYSYLIDPKDPSKNKPLQKVMEHSHHLGVMPIVDLCTAKIADLIKPLAGKPAEIRKLLGIAEADFGDRKFRTDEEIKAFAELKPADQ
jgi:hypothetical protein